MDVGQWTVVLMNIIHCCCRENVLYITALHLSAVWFSSHASCFYVKSKHIRRELCVLPMKLSLLNFVFPCCVLPIELESLVTSDTWGTNLGCLTLLFISCRHRLLAVLGGNGCKSIGVREEEEIKYKFCLLGRYTKLYYLVQHYLIKNLENV